MLNDPVQRALMAKRNVVNSRVEDDDNPRVQWREKIVGKRADIRMQLNDSRLFMQHAAMVQNTMRELLVAMDQLKDEQAKLYLAGATIRELSKKISAKRRWD